MMMTGTHLPSELIPKRRIGKSPSRETENKQFHLPIKLPYGLYKMNFDNKEFKELLESIRFVYGYDFTDYAEASVRRRTDQFMNKRKITALDTFGKMLLQDEKLFENFVQELSVTVTEMFRDPVFYKSLRDNVLKRLATYPFIKVWIAGCATGEEIYSIAILLQEEDLLNRSVIYATDINQKSIQVAKDGVYAVENMKSYTAN